MIDLLAAAFPRVLGVSLTTGLVVAALLLATPALAGRVKARWRCLVWGVLALRLLIPLQVSFPAAPVEISLSQTAVAQSQPPSAAPEDDGESAPPAQPAPEETTPGTALAPDAVSAPTLTGLELAALIWAVGGSGFLLWQGGRYLWFRKHLLRDAQPFREEEILQEASQALGLARTIPVAVSPTAPAPMTLGLLHPLVVLPSRAYRRGELVCILCHELAHWQGRHLWCKLLFLLARGVHWFNPLVHLMARRGAADLELACDDRVLAGAGPDRRRAYAHTILAAMADQPAPAACLTTHLQGGKTMMKARFHNILRPVPAARGKFLPVAALAAALLLGSLVSCTGEPKAADVLTLPAEGTYSGTVLGVTAVEGQPAVLQKEAALGNAFTLYAPEEDGRYQFVPYTGEPYRLRPGDMVLITDTLGEDLQVWVVGMDVPALQGTLPAEAVSTAPADFAGANQAGLPDNTPVYDAPEGAQTGTLGLDLAAVTSREGDWAQITPPGGDNPCWVQASDLDYDHFAQNLDTLDLTRYLTPAGEPRWMLTPETSNLMDYTAEEERTAVPDDWTLPAGTLDAFTRTEVKGDLLLYGPYAETGMEEGFTVARYADGTLTPVYTFQAGMTLTWQQFFSPDGASLAFPWEPVLQTEADIGQWKLRVVDLSNGSETDLTLPDWAGHTKEMVCTRWLDDQTLQVSAYDLTALQAGEEDSSITWTCALAGGYTTAPEPATTPSAHDYTVTPGEDGTYTVTADGVQVGGAAWIPYPGADQVDFAAYFDVYDTAANREPAEQVLRAVWAQRLGPGAEPDHMASGSDVADVEDFIVTDQGGENHYLFMDGDRIYDAWFREGALTGQQMQAVLDSALPTHLS